MEFFPILFPRDFLKGNNTTIKHRNEKKVRQVGKDLKTREEKKPNKKKRERSERGTKPITTRTEKTDKVRVLMDFTLIPGAMLQKLTFTLKSLIIATRSMVSTVL